MDIKDYITKFEKEYNGDNLNEIVELLEKALQDCAKEAREEALGEAEDAVQTHSEDDELGYCDTGSDMEFACRADCTRMAFERIRKL